MSGILSNILRANVFKTVQLPIMRQGMGFGITTNSIRTLSHMAKVPGKIPAINTWHKSSFGCSCGCGSRFNHTLDGSAELLDFLNQEINSEKRFQQHVKISTNINGFEVKFDGADVELVKKLDNESIEVVFNVNHTVDSSTHDEEFDVTANKEDQEDEEKGDNLHSKPNFEVNITKNGTTLSFTCQFLSASPVDGEFDDVFGIQEITVYRGEHNDKVYACAGDILDGYLYDLLMNLLEKRGITYDFAQRLVSLSTNYERTLYIQLLESLKSFA